MRETSAYVCIHSLRSLALEALKLERLPKTTFKQIGELNNINRDVSATSSAAIARLFYISELFPFFFFLSALVFYLFPFFSDDCSTLCFYSFFGASCAASHDIYSVQRLEEGERGIKSGSFSFSSYSKEDTTLLHACFALRLT